jgi:hypothetical protein
MASCHAMPGPGRQLDGARHAAKVARIAAALRACSADRPVSLRKRGVAHQVPKSNDLRRRDQKVDVADLNEILEIDVASIRGTCFETCTR